MTDAGKAYNDNWRGEMDTSKNGYSILVKFEKGKSFITPYLRSKGFKPFGHGYCGCDWIWVLLDRKKYAYGMPGIKMADIMYDHAVTVEEYNTILKLYEQGVDLYESDVVSEIYAKYKGLAPLDMGIENQVLAAGEKGRSESDKKG